MHCPLLRCWPVDHICPVFRSAVGGDSVLLSHLHVCHVPCLLLPKSAIFTFNYSLLKTDNISNVSFNLETVLDPLCLFFFFPNIFPVSKRSFVLSF